MAVGFELQRTQRARCCLDGAAMIEGGDQHQGQEGQRKPVHLSPDHARATGLEPLGGRRGKHWFLSLPRQLIGHECGPAILFPVIYVG